MSTTFTVGGKPVSLEYIKDSIKALGPIRWLKLNPWARDALPVKKPTKRTMSADEFHTKTVLAHAQKEMARDLRDQGWTWSQIAQLGIGQQALDRRMRREARDNARAPVYTTV